MTRQDIRPTRGRSMLRGYACRQVRYLFGGQGRREQDLMDGMHAIDPDAALEPASGEARGTAAAQLLLHAQQVADELRQKAEQQASEAMALAEQLEGESRRLHDEAKADRDAAARALALADAQLAEGSREARQSVADAGEQVRMLLEAAESQREAILADATEAARRDRTAADQELARTREESERLWLTAHAEADRKLATSAMLTLRLLTLATIAMRHQQLETVRAAEELRVTADEDATAVRAQAAQEAETLRKDADTHAHAVLADAEQVRSHAHATSEELLRHARAEAAQAIQAAQEQTTWTQETMASLLATAEQEAERIRLDGRADSARHVAHSRRRLQAVVHRVGERLRADMAAAERDAEELGAVAASLVTAAEADAERIRREAEEAGRATVAAAEDEVSLVHDRARRREEETESTTRLLRQQVAEEVVNNRQTAQDELRRARQEAADHVAAARAEADELRSKARAVLEDARTEAAVLTKRRDEIAAELEGLSGVIQALAVPTESAPEEKETP